MTALQPGGVPTAEELLARAWERRREGRLEEARLALEEAARISGGDGSPVERMRILGALAHFARDQGREDEALDLYEEAVRLGRGQDDLAALAHTVRHLGDVHRGAGRLEEAERCYAEALDLYQRDSDAPPLDLANALRPMALVREAQGNVGESVDLWRKARRIYDELGITEGVEECDRNLATLG